MKALFSYARKDVCPRWRAILLGAEFWCSLGFAFATPIIGREWLLGAGVNEIASGLLSYAAIAAGFSLAGMTLALTLPSDAFIDYLINLRLPNKPGNGYADLIFVFSWTATAHWALVVISLLALVVCSGQKALPNATMTARQIGIGAVAFCSSYGALQFLIVVVTLSQVAGAFVAWKKRISPALFKPSIFSPPNRLRCVGQRFRVRRRTPRN